MAYSDPLLQPDGFEGILIEDSPKDIIEEAKAFQGIVVSTISNLIPKTPVGFEGILITYSDSERFIKVTDYRGNPLVGVLVTAQNSGGNISGITGENGIVALEIDTTGSVPIKLEKEKTFKNLSYIHASEPSLKEVVLQPPLL